MTAFNEGYQKAISSMFLGLVEVLKSQGIIKDKHLADMRDTCVGTRIEVHKTLELEDSQQLEETFKRV